MKVTTKSQLVLFSALFLLSVLSLFLSLVVKWQTTSLSDNKFLTVPLLISALSAHSLQPLSRHVIQLENIFVVFGSVFLFQPQGSVSLSTQSDEIRNLMLLKRRLHEINPTESDEHQHSKSRAVSAGSKVKSLRSQLTNKEKKLSRKEELSNRILEEIESLDPLKCLPKALCSLSAQPADLITHSSDPGQGLSEQEQKNNDVVNEYLELMKTIITMEPQSKRKEKNRLITPPKSQLEKPPKAETKENDEDEYDTSDYDDEEGEDEEDDIENNDDENEEEVSNEHEHKQESKRRPVSIIRPNNFRHNPPAIPKPPRPSLDHSDKWYYNEKHKIRNMLATTEDPYGLGNTDILYPDYEHKPRPHRRPPPPPMRDTRHGFNNYGHGNKNKHKKPNENPPVSYSQQYHYMSAPGPLAPADVHGGYQTQGYDNYHHEPPYQASITEYQSAFTSMVYYYMPNFVKKILDFVMPVFTFEYSPIEGTPPNIFKDDPFFDGFKKKQGLFSVGYGRSLSGDAPIEKASTVIERRTGRSLDDIMVDARDRFAGALEIGQTFKNVRKCQAVYSTCPFKHTQIVEMINALKEKMQLQKFVYNKISRFAEKNQAPQQAEDRNMDLSKPAFSPLSKEKQNPGSKENTDTSHSKEDVISKILKRKWDTDTTTIKPSTTTDSNSYSKISFSHEQNFQRKPLVIRNIHNILRTGLHAHSSETDSDSPTKQITIIRDKTGLNSNGEDPKNVHKTYNEKEFMSRSTEYSDSVESIEDLLAVANSHKSLLQKYQQLQQQQQSSKNANSKYVVHKAGKSNDTPQVTSTTEAPSFFQTFISFFKN